MPKEKSLTKKRYKFCQEKKVLPRRYVGFAKRKKSSQKIYSFDQEIKVWPRRDIGFVKKENFSQKDIYVLLREKSLAKKIYRFWQKRNV